MQAVVDIKFDELLKIVKDLPESKLSELKTAIQDLPTQNKSRAEFEALLLNGPTFSDEQINAIENTRKQINKWRKK